jgi:hypothetical protein
MIVINPLIFCSATRTIYTHCEIPTAGNSAVNSSSFAHLSFLSYGIGTGINDFNGDLFGVVLPWRFDVPLCHFGGAIPGINLIGFAIPMFISLKLLLLQLLFLLCYSELHGK